MTLHYKNKTMCIVNPLENELPEHFIDRCNFITSQPMKNDDEYNKVINYSYIYSNNKYLGCIYDDKIMDQLKLMIKKLHVF
jgi:hypothetical protein